MRTLVAVGAVLSLACLWDYDTLKEESLGQAEVAQIVGGDLHKHSRAFYEAKVAYTSNPTTAERFDDLAVAQAKLGKLDDALATLAAKEAKFAGAYETEANLGTVYAMKGDTKAALEHLNKAIAINPDAHFGREKFQIRYLAWRAAGKHADNENFLGIDTGKTFAGESPVIIHLSKAAKSRVANPAVVAIAGLIRFGSGEDDPQLWYALAWALVDQGDAQLAVRAFRRAEGLGHPRAGADGAVISTTIKALDAGCCAPATDPRTVKAWTAIAPVIDREWKAGAAVDAKRQADEDKLIARKQLKAAFGY